MAVSEAHRGFGDPRAHSSAAAPERFLTHHALRIKGFASSSSLSDSTGLEIGRVEENLSVLSESGLASFRETRSLWQITPEGRSAHRLALEEDNKAHRLGDLVAHYEDFLEVNGSFKSLCGSWQLREGEPNDHSDLGYDSAIVAQLVGIDGSARAILSAMTRVLPRLAPYAGRLEAACRAVSLGDHRLFTGVMCNSYHDIWMELHQDLILTQGIDRATEGSF